MEAFAGAAVGATIQVLVQAILSKSIQEIINMWGFEKDLKKLENSLLMIQDFLSDAEEQRDCKKAVKRWLEQLEDVAYKADAVIDEFNYELLRKKVNNQKRETRKVTLSFFSSSSSSLLFRRKMADKIRDVNKKLESINEEAKSFGLQTKVGNAGHYGLMESIIPAEQLTDSFSVEPNVVGREHDVSDVVNKLVDAPVHETISVIPIVGMGGLGKTTVARKVFHDGTIDTHFGKKVWLCVSMHFDAVFLLKMILESLSTSENIHAIMTREVLLEKIKEHLIGKRYLLVLDDIWNQESNKWHNFIISLSGISTVKGNCILVTTRNEIVASIVKTLPSHQLEALSTGHCWSIIKSKALRVDDSIEFEEIGERIAQKCGGLPLAANVVGGLLYGKSKDEWLAIFNDQLSYFGRDENTVNRILQLSYDRLPSLPLKKCFTYCSIFPQDYLIEKDILIELWMAEGFLQADERSDMETLGDIYFRQLLHNSLFQEAKADEFGNIKSCKMHDLVHDMACLVSGSKNLHHVRYHFPKSSTYEPSDFPKTQAKYLRTIFFTGEVMDSMFSAFKCLHVLKLVGADVKELPKVIGKLIHLRYLDVKDTKIEYLPDSIGRLYHLQTLRTTQEFGSTLRKLPDTLTNLINLRHLHIPPIRLPPGIGKLTSLRTLPYYNVRKEKGCKIGELRMLKNLSGELEIKNLEIVNDKEEAKCADLLGKPNIFSLVLSWNNSRDQDERNDESVLEGLQPHANLKSLTIEGYQGKKFPLWTMKMTVHDGSIGGPYERLDNLMTIRLTRCTQCEEIPVVGHLPRLKNLELIDLPKVRYIGLSFYGFESCSTPSSMLSNFQEKVIPFPALEKLVLKLMPNLVEWVNMGNATALVFPCLKFLKIEDCPKLKRAPFNFPCLESFHIENVDADFPLTDTCKDLTSIESLELKSLPGLINFPDSYFVNNQNISSLKISYCPNLTFIADSCSSLVGGSSSLRELAVLVCDNLRRIPDCLNNLQRLDVYNCTELRTISQCLTSMRTLTIYGCPKFTSLQCGALESCTTMMDLRLESLENFVDFTPSFLCQSRMLCLDILTLVNLPRLVNFPTGVRFPSNLQDLEIGLFSDTMELVSFNDFLGRSLQDCRSLRRLTLYGQDNWYTLPDQIQYLAALEYLQIYGFKIEALPEWLGNMSSLQELSFGWCQKLLNLPSKEAMQRLVNLGLLRLNWCPLVAERCTPQQNNKSEDSEWLKISHIPHVYIDGQYI